MNFREVAETLAEVLGRKIVYIKCDRQEMRDIMLKNAMSENAADMMLEMYDAVENGRLRTTQPRRPKQRPPPRWQSSPARSILPMITDARRFTR